MKTKLEELRLCLDDADRRFNIAICKMSEITNRVHELEVRRNLALRKQFLIRQNLTKEADKIKSNSNDIQIYEEVVQGYRSLSRRKNELEQERNHYVYAIEEEE